MILINGQAKSNDEVIKMFDLPGDKIKKYCEFQINENLKGFDLGSRKKRDIEPQKFPAYFNAEDKNGNMVEIRYAARKSQVRDKVTKQMIDIYSPKKVQIDGNATVCTKLDFGIYLFLNKRHKDSPFRDQGAVVWTYSFVDKSLLAKADIERGDAMRKALNHANSATGKDLRLMAKGLGILAVDEMDEEEIRGSLTNLALAGPAEYLDKVGKQATKMEGRILDVIDKNLVKLDESYGTPKWLWNGGPNKGQLICEVTNLSITPREFLVNFVKSDLPRFYSDIMKLQENADANSKAEAFLEKQHKEIEYTEVEPEPDDDLDEDFELIPGSKDEKEVVSIEDFPESEDIGGGDDEDGPELPTDFKSSQAYIIAVKGSAGSPKQAKELWDACVTGEVTKANVRGWLKENFNI